jgi:hypothetical protein
LGAIEEYKLKIKVFETNWMQKLPLLILFVGTKL